MGFISFSGATPEYQGYFFLAQFFWTCLNLLCHQLQLNFHQNAIVYHL